MGKGASTPTRVTADIAAAAASVSAAENRSATEQINFWARLGMNLDRAGTASHRRVIAVATGEAQFSSLSTEERAAAHAFVDARIDDAVATAQFGSAAQRAGQTTVSVDDDGNLIEIRPDGGRRRLEPS